MEDKDKLQAYFEYVDEHGTKEEKVDKDLFLNNLQYMEQTSELALQLIPGGKWSIADVPKSFNRMVHREWMIKQLEEGLYAKLDSLAKEEGEDGVHRFVKNIGLFVSGMIRDDKKRLANPFIDEEEKKIIEFNISSWQNMIDQFEETAQALYEDEADPASQNKQQPIPSMEHTDAKYNIFDGVEWKGAKADLAELIKGLAFTGSIYKDGRPITQKDLQSVFENLLNTEIGDLQGTFNARLNSQKHQLNRFFVEKIFDHIESITKDMAEEIRRQADKKQL